MERTRNQDRASSLQRWNDLKSKQIPVGEHVINVLKAGLSATGLGGAIASLIDDYIPSWRFARLEEFASCVAGDLDRLQSRIDKDFLLTEDFAFMFERAFKAASENHQKDKLETFRNILVNSAIDRDLPSQEKEYFLNLAMSLSSIHIRILKFMDTPAAYLQEAGIPPASIKGGFAQFFPIAIPGIDLEVIKSAFADLHRFALINTDRSIFSTMTVGQGLELLRGRVSQLGQRFTRFCSAALPLMAEKSTQFVES